MSEPTEADRALAVEFTSRARTWAEVDRSEVGLQDLFERIAQALADERERARAPFLALAAQWVDMAHDHAEQGATNTALVYAAHARQLRRAAGETGR